MEKLKKIDERMTWNWKRGYKLLAVTTLRVKTANPEERTAAHGNQRHASILTNLPDDETVYQVFHDQHVDFHCALFLIDSRDLVAEVNFHTW